MTPDEHILIRAGWIPDANNLWRSPLTGRVYLVGNRALAARHRSAHNAQATPQNAMENIEAATAITADYIIRIQEAALELLWPTTGITCIPMLSELVGVNVRLINDSILLSLEFASVAGPHSQEHVTKVQARLPMLFRARDHCEAML